jgi:pimeloyl-ACP methyl ester carboxylesterase
LAGAGIPLIALPGLQGTGDIHYRLALRLHRLKLRTIAITPPAEPEAWRLADGLAMLLDKLCLDRVHLYGSSIGGYLAQVFAQRHHERVKVLFIGNSFHDPSISQAKYPTLDRVRAESAQARLDATIARTVKMAVSEPDQAELRDALLAIVGHHQSAEALKARVLCLLTADAIGVVPIPSSRVVLIDSDDDAAISVQQREGLRRRYSRSSHYAISGGGHYPSILRPEELAESIALHMQKSEVAVSST